MKKGRQHRHISELDTKLTEEAELLDRYLKQYKSCISKKQILERRKQEFRKEFSPVRSPNMDGMPRSSAVGEGMAVALVIRLDEIEEKIGEQIRRSVKLLSDVMDIIDLLPEKSKDERLTRSIIENRYIDRMSWGQICNENCCSQSSVRRYWKQGLYTLLEFKKVKNVMEDFKEEEDNAAEEA